MLSIELAERRLAPDAAISWGIRRLLAGRLAQSARESSGDPVVDAQRFARWMDQQPLAVDTEAANAQHYEVPAAFYQVALGPRLKYSSGYWPVGVDSLAASEEAMLRLTCERAGLVDGQSILELGCGWGSLTLWMAEHYPRCRIVAMSNSLSQREFILARAAERGCTNVTVVTANIADFHTSDQFDRVVSVEMFEHVRNYRQLLRRIRGWLTSDARLFVHIFCHRRYAYAFEEASGRDWMTRHFFSGGVMPSEGLLTQFADELPVTEQWWVSGEHYAKTCRGWLDKVDRHRKAALTALGGDPRRLQRWRMFFMACEELFAYDHGDQWGVGHYLLSP